MPATYIVIEEALVGGLAKEGKRRLALDQTVDNDMGDVHILRAVLARNGLGQAGDVLGTCCAVHPLLCQFLRRTYSLRQRARTLRGHECCLWHP